MATITITLPDDRVSKLKEIASRFQVTPEELVRVSVDDLLSRPNEAFGKAVDHVLANNAEPHRRLA